MRKPLRWSIVLMLFLAGMVSYLDRAAFAIVAPMIARDLSLSPSELGLAFSALFFGYAVFCFVGGWAADRLGGKKILAAAMLGWSTFCALTAAAVTFPMVVKGPRTDPFGNTRIGLDGSFSVDRQDFAVEFDRKLPNGDPIVGDQVDIQFQVEGIRGTRGVKAPEAAQAPSGETQSEGK